VLNENENAVTSHSFDFPTEMCGRLIGQRGRNVAVIKEKSGVEIIVRAKRYDASWQTVTLEGELGHCFCSLIVIGLTDRSFISVHVWILCSVVLISGLFSRSSNPIVLEMIAMIIAVRAVMLNMFNMIY